MCNRICYCQECKVFQSAKKQEDGEVICPVKNIPVWFDSDADQTCLPIIKEGHE